MPNEPGFKNSELIHLLDIANQRLRHHHDSLWKEEVHYTWLSYILVAGLIYILVVTAQTKYDLMSTIGFFSASLAISIIGIFISIMGFKVVRFEGEYFHTANEIRNRLHRALKLHEYTVEGKRTFPHEELGTPKEWGEVKIDANKCLRQLFSCKVKHTIRDFFQITLILPFFIFCLAIPYSVTSFILYYKSIS